MHAVVTRPEYNRKQYVITINNPLPISYFTVSNRKNKILRAIHEVLRGVPE